MDWTLLAGIAKGLGAGIVTAAVGYVKNLPDGESFNWTKSVPTLVIGGIVGVVAVVAAVPVDTATEMVASFGIVVLINQLWSAISKWYANRTPKKKR